MLCKNFIHVCIVCCKCYEYFVQGSLLAMKSQTVVEKLRWNSNKFLKSKQAVVWKGMQRSHLCYIFVFVGVYHALVEGGSTNKVLPSLS